MKKGEGDQRPQDSVSCSTAACLCAHQRPHLSRSSIVGTSLTQKNRFGLLSSQQQATFARHQISAWVCGLSRIVVEVTDFLLKNEAETTTLIDRAVRNAMTACSHAAARGFLEATSAEDDPRRGRRVALQASSTLTH